MDRLSFTLNDKPFHAIAQGEPNAPLMLFLHGFPEYSGSWQDMVARLSDRFYCVAPDQRGYGQSWREGDVSDYSTKHLTSDALAMIDKFGGGNAAAVVGHDWGASVAYACAMRAPEKIKRLVIANGVHPAPFQTALAAGGAQSKASQYIEWLRKPESEKALVANGFERMFGMFAKHMNMDWLTPAKQEEYRKAWHDEAGVRGMVNWYRATPLQVAKPGEPIASESLPKWDREALRVSMPHLLLWGMKDAALLPETKNGLDDFCDNLTVIEHPDADHWIIHQQPDWVEMQIRKFLS